MRPLSPTTNGCYHGQIQAQQQMLKNLNEVVQELPGCRLPAVGKPVYVKKPLRVRSAVEVETGVTSIEWIENTALNQIRLGEAVYHIETERLITATGGEIFLRAQSSIVLQVLATNLDALVTRDELIAKVWPDIAVTDDSLTQCISDIRKALDDQKRTILKTVPKRGYILHGERFEITKADFETTKAASVPLHFAEVGLQHVTKKKTALAVCGDSETVQTVINDLPSNFRPESTQVRNDNTFILIFQEPAPTLHAAHHIAKTNQLVVAVDYTQGDGSEAENLLQVAKKGEILTSPDMSATVSLGAEFYFSDLGEVETQNEIGKLRPFRVSRRDAQHSVLAQLDARDVLPTLVILPFRVQSDTSDTMLGTFLADEITAAVGRSEDVNVISRLSAGTIDKHVDDLRNIGRLLNADFVLSGTLYQKGNKVIGVIEFAETDTQIVLWSDRLELTIDPSLQQTEGVDQIVAQIRKAIMLNEVRRVRSKPLHDLKLFSVLHGAVGLMHRLSLKEFLLARSYLNYVISKAPNHPAPLAWLARWHVLRTVQGWADDVNQDAREALDLTARALDIDPDHTLALICEGQVLANLAHRLDEAEDRYDAALITNPNDAQGRALRGMLVSFRDRGTEGKRDAERALHLTPIDPHRFMFLALAAGANIGAEDYPRAVTLAKESLRLNRTHISTLRTLAVAQVGAGDQEDAVKTAAQLLHLQPDLRVSRWLKNSPGGHYKMARSAAEKLRSIGIPD